DSEYGSIFVWDRDYVSEIQARGCRRVHYLPLAADESTFRALNGRPNPLARLACPVSFVGDSMVRPVDDKAARLGLPARAWPLIDRAARAFIDSPDLEPGRLLDRSELAEQNRDLPFGSSHRVDLEGLITWRATQIYRLERVKALAPLGPTVVGDEGWRRLLDEQLFTLAPPLDYYEQLPYFYPLSRVNFNATSRQMKNGLNQRVFDVPACGAFVLTDHQAQIEDLFEVGREVVCYQTPEEALDLARFYLAHEGARLEIAGNGRRRVLAHHTYRHRLDRLIRQMREDFAS
ncbi:MAG: glycosyltransferase, partial [Proteobacteria bacterium]|nr:glycosyltransferase [Pseudomonadota bacterium]